MPRNVTEWSKSPNFPFCNYIPTQLLLEGGGAQKWSKQSMTRFLDTPSKIDSDPPYYLPAKLYTLCCPVTFWPQNGVKQPDYKVGHQTVIQSGSCMANRRYFEVYRKYFGHLHFSLPKNLLLIMSCCYKYWGSVMNERKRNVIRILYKWLTAWQICLFHVLEIRCDLWAVNRSNNIL